ncbi:hypothetical protein CLU96_1224 [Chryseobacterium sp. 52]|uniref:hypothetical protein n=1 Tax=Chryseobacterium sp. 52 TaxID=2035213 RepID=UPI000C1876EC|nr:hypothetical protein [Chryseobacterium sp. 52]PIF44283.1 hypothetical protein CLU96_1224 [Chryseobacterium sp. 52]
MNNLKSKTLDGLKEIVYNLNNHNISGNIEVIRENTNNEYHHIIVEGVDFDTLKLMDESTRGLVSNLSFYCEITKRFFNDTKSPKEFDWVGVIRPRISYLTETEREKLNIIYA